MVPVPEFTYVPLRVAWEQFGAGTCALTAEVVRNTARIAPSVAKPVALRLAFFIPISFDFSDPKTFVILDSSCSYSANGRQRGSPVLIFFMVGSPPA
jgi:hypothetical protein